LRRGNGLVSFTLADRSAAERFLAASVLIAEATSFGGVHSTAERRGRWGGDAVPPGFVRLSCGIEDTADLLSDVERALDAAVTER
jgi:cystathionine gamma-lyase